MNIAFLCNQWPVAGGIETVTRILANEMTARGHHVVVVCTEWSAPQEMAFVDPRITTELMAGGDFAVRAPRFVEDCWRRHRLDVIVNQCYPTWTASMLAGLRGRVKIIECLHMTLFYPTRYWRLGWTGYDLKMRLLGPWLYRRREKLWRCEALEREFPSVDRFVMLSAAFVREYHDFRGSSRDNGRLVSISNPVEPLAHTTAADLGRKENVVLCVARMSEREKRISLMLHTWKGIEADRRFDHWRFDLVGDGPSLADYRRLARDLGLRRVTFHGHRNPQPYYRRSRIFLMTSVAEGFGMTLVEAQQQGVVPLVLDTFSSVRDIIDDGRNGRLVRPGSRRRFLKALKLMMADGEALRQMALEGMASCGRFSVQLIADQWEALIAGIPAPLLPTDAHAPLTPAAEQAETAHPHVGGTVAEQADEHHADSQVKG